MTKRAFMMALPLLTGCMALDRVGLGELAEQPPRDAEVMSDADTAVAAADGGDAVEHDAYLPESVDAAVSPDEEPEDVLDEELEEPDEDDAEDADDEPEPSEDESEQSEDRSEQSEEEVEGSD